jgi:hypothetical protein
MRDYVQLFYTVDDTPVGPNFYFTSYYFFETQEECDSFVSAYPISPGGGLLSATMPVWFRWNKKVINSWVNSSNVQNLGPTPIAGEKGQNIYLESPRKFGINSATEKRVPVPSDQFTAKRSDFTGAQGLVTFIDSLPALAAILKKEGRVRDAGIVTYAYNQVISQKWSVTTALDYLRKNRIV